MKKDIEWLKREIHKELESWQGVEGGIDGDGINEIMLLINQLDEPEVLSQEWIDEHSNGPSRSQYVWVDDLKEQLVPKQELPTIPWFVAKWIKEVKKQNKSLVFAIAHIYDKNEIGQSPNKEENRIFRWMESDDNEEVFARAWLDDYMIKEEQKYIVSDNSSVPLLIKNDSGEIMSYDSQIAYNNSNGTIELTEQEIKDYDSRYLTFAKPVDEISKALSDIENNRINTYKTFDELLEELEE